MISISCNSIAVEFGVTTILSDVSFALNDGDRLGIVGVNGAGKTTLLRAITGDITPTAGTVYISKDKTVGYFKQDSSFDSEKNILDSMLSSFDALQAAERKLDELQKKMSSGDVSASDEYQRINEEYMAKGGYEYKSRAKTMLKSFGFSEDMWEKPVSVLSGGQKTTLALISLLLKAPDILILDEPTNHLDTEALAWLEDFLQKYRKTVLIVSHDRYFLDMAVNKILQIEYGKGTLYSGNYSDYVLKREQDKAVYEHQYNVQQKEIKRIEAYIALQRKWNRERNIIAAESREKMLARMVKLEKPAKDPSKIHFDFTKSAISGANEVLCVKGLSKSFDGKKLFEDISFLITRGEHAFIYGKNGCGKSTLIKILASKIAADNGTFEFGNNIKIAYYDQENQNLDPKKTVLDEMWDTDRKMTQTEVRKILAQFLFLGEDVQKTVSVLSGGEKARLTLAKLIKNGANVLILDEPTNHLDINSREVLENALCDFEGTIIAVSHDRYFINKLSTRILDMSNGKFFDYMGSFEEYSAYRTLQKACENGDAAPKVQSSKETYLDSKQRESEARKAETKLRRAKEEIEKLERQIAELEDAAKLCQSDYVKLGEIDIKKSKCEERLLELYSLIM